MVQGLARRFGNVRLLCLGIAGMPAYQREGDIEIYRFTTRHRNLLRRATAFARFVASHTRQLRGTLRIAGFRDPWGGYPLLRTQPRCPTLFEVNALPSWELAYSRPAISDEPALMAKIRDIERFCLGEATSILCVSSVTRRALIGLEVDPAKITTIPNAAGDIFRQAATAPCAIPALHSGRWIGYIGGLQAWQGIDTLLDAFALVAGALPDFNLLILHGDSTRAVDLTEKRISRHDLRRRVMLHSAISHPEVAGVLKRLEFTTVPLADTPRNTVQGCCPIKLVESMAAGTPVIASDLAVCREWVTHEQNGLLVEAGDRRGWALNLHRMATDNRLRSRLAAAAAASAAEHFSWGGVHQRLDDLFLHTATH